MMLVVLILVSAIVALVTTWFWVYQKYDRYLKRFSGPRPLPVLGNALEIGSTDEILPFFLRMQQKYGGIVKTSIGIGPPMLLITDCKFLEYLLGTTKILDKAKDYEFLERWLGTGLLTSKSEKWRKHRKILTPAFHFQILEQFIEIFDTNTNILLKKLEKEKETLNFKEKDSTDIYPYVTLCSLDIICGTSMGTEVNAQENAESDYVYSVKEMCRIIIERSTSVLKYSDIFYFLSRDYRKEKRALKILHGYTYSVINSRKKELENANYDDESIVKDDVGIKKKKTLLDLMLQYKKSGEELTDEDIREEVDTFMFEGHDTTASGISFALYCLAENQEVQKKVVEELHAIFGSDTSRSATHRELMEMKYLEQVIKETLRLYPSVPIYLRNVHEDTEYDGIVLPKRLTLAIFAYGVHRRPDIYPDPERFDPERFTPENQAKRSPYAYLPFSAGPRNCIGQKFAMLEMKSVLSKILRNFELLSTVPQHKLVLLSETVLKSKTGVKIRLRKRNFEEL